MKKIIIFTLIITLPINILGFIWAHNTRDTYFLLEKYKLTLDKGKKLSRIGTSEFYDLKHSIHSLLGIERKTDVALIIPNRHINSLNSDLPLSGNDYKKDALLIVDNKAIKGKVKLRGDHYYHWGFARKSWRFKTSKKDIYNGINKINLIIPKSVDMLLNHLSYNLAKTMGLLAPTSQLVDFSVNGKYKGSRLLVEQIDESFMRKNRRMPNDVYKGDNIGQNKYVGVNAGLFTHASIWEKASYNNHYAKGNLYPLEKLLDEIKANQFNILDFKSFATMAAYIDLTGSHHHDRTHNWILYYDNYYEQMYPIIWDTIGWSVHTVKLTNMNIATSELLESLYLNYDFLREKNKALKLFFLTQENKFNTILNKSIQDSKAIIKKNHYTFDLGRKILSEKNALESVEEFESAVVNRLAVVKQYFLGDVDKSNYKFSINNKKIRLSIADSKAVNALNISVTDTAKYKRTLLSYQQGNHSITKDISDKVTIKNNKVIIDIDLYANTKNVKSFQGTPKIDYHAATYDIEFVGINPQHIDSVALSFDNLKHQTIEIQKVAELKQMVFDERLQNIISQTVIRKNMSWSGEKHFKGFTIIEENINIKKGTKLIFDEGATLKVLGKVTAVGTIDNPIVFEALDSSKPWGAFALKDKAANGSIFKHVIFKGGSGDKGDLHEYTAMFSIHNVQDVLVEDSEFYDSKLTDDMVHVIYSDIKFKNTKFVRSLSDALDIDISTAVIESCEFINSGNDAIDLMTSNAVVINTKFSHSIDKGISIGEGSNLLAINNLIENSEIGMQSKDTSKAYIYNTTFIANKKAIDAYHKNWRYSEGGTIYVENCIMENNLENATVGKKSKVVINNCQIDSVDNFNAKALRKGKIVVGDNQAITAGFEQTFFHNHNELIQNNVKGYHE